MTEKTLKFVVIGSGHWGFNYVRLLFQYPGVELVAVCDLSNDRLQEVKKHFPSIKLYQNVDQVLKSEKVDAAVICTEPSNHFALAQPIIEAGIHTLVEKPITTKNEESQVLTKLAKQKNVVLMVGHIFLFNPGISKVKDEIDSGNFGEIHYLYSIRTNLGPIRDDVNAIWDLAPHDISIFNYFLDSSPIWVSAVGSSFLKPGRMDVGFLVLRYSKDIIANIHVSWADPNKVRETVVVGSNQRVVFNDLSSQKVTIYKKGIAASSLPFLSYGDYQLSLRDGDIVSPSLTSTEPLKTQLEHFIHCVRSGQNPISDGLSGTNVVKVLEAADASMSLNGAPIKIQY